MLSPDFERLNTSLRNPRRRDSDSGLLEAGLEWLASQKLNPPVPVPVVVLKVMPTERGWLQVRGIAVRDRLPLEDAFLADRIDEGDTTCCLGGNNTYGRPRAVHFDPQSYYTCRLYNLMGKWVTCDWELLTTAFDPHSA